MKFKAGDLIYLPIYNSNVRREIIGVDGDDYLVKFDEDITPTHLNIAWVDRSCRKLTKLDKALK